MICKCDKCEKQFDSKDGGCVVSQLESSKTFCEECINEELNYENK